MQEWYHIVCTDKSRFCVPHCEGHIRVWKHREKRTPPVCIRYRQTDPVPEVRVRNFSGTTTLTRIVRLQSVLNCSYLKDGHWEPLKISKMSSFNNITQDRMFSVFTGLPPYSGFSVVALTNELSRSLSYCKYSVMVYRKIG
ncbi:hypothetical protein TNCV_708211 [Trichonephila clavipes]|nr:hypothetical protein TNCV_708211 [Trichonephila clavipes]